MCFAVDVFLFVCIGPGGDLFFFAWILMLWLFMAQGECTSVFSVALLV
jgi:hypothetical protein